MERSKFLKAYGELRARFQRLLDDPSASPQEVRFVADRLDIMRRKTRRLRNRQNGTKQGKG